MTTERKPTLRKRADGRYAVIVNDKEIGEVRHAWLPSHIRRGRTQAAPLWAVYRLNPGEYYGPVGRPRAYGRTQYEFQTRHEAVALLTEVVSAGSEYHV